MLSYSGFVFNISATLMYSAVCLCEKEGMLVLCNKAKQQTTNQNHTGIKCCNNICCTLLWCFEVILLCFNEEGFVTLKGINKVVFFSFSVVFRTVSLAMPITTSDCTL